MVTVQPAAVAVFGQRGARPITEALAGASPVATADQLHDIDATLTRLAEQLLPATLPRTGTRDVTARIRHPRAYPLSSWPWRCAGTRSPSACGGWRPAH